MGLATGRVGHAAWCRPSPQPRESSTNHLATAPLRRPGRVDLGEDALAEKISGSRERVGDVGVEALEASPSARAADAELERGPAVPALTASGEPAAKLPLLAGRTLEAAGELGVAGRSPAPALDAATRLEP